jgi:chemotaxis protein methyltransferase CheR
MTAPLHRDDAEAIEIGLLLEAVFQGYGFDFRNYALPSLRRRIWISVRDEGLQSVSELQAKLLRDSDCMERFLLTVTVNVTTMYRDPSFYRAFRARVVPRLRSQPFLRIWQVGCSTGEEVYSLAILLHEEGLYPKCRIYATDINEAVLNKAKAGIFPLACVQEYTGNYQRAGGAVSFSEYYTARYDHVIFKHALAENVVFAQHNLVTDNSFNEFHVILCRNVLFYFNPTLSQRVHRLLYDSLALSGFLALGRKESLRFTPYETRYEEYDAEERLYRRIE